MRPSHFTPKQLDEAIRMRQLGAAWPDILRALGSTSTVSALLNAIRRNRPEHYRALVSELRRKRSA